MKFKILKLITFLVSTQFAYAENHLLILGGGGEPEVASTIFDGGMKDFGYNLKKSKWKYDISFNGGHRKTEKILKKQYSKGETPPTDFTRENLTNLIASYKNKIVSGRIKSGDQLMIMINTHGAEKGSQEVTHKIALKGGAFTNLNSLAGSELVSLDSLQEIVELTNERGINLGIIDLSCHSGNTLELKKNATNTCIISASGPLHYGFAGRGTFTNNFLANLRPGVNLEEAFLKSRRDSTAVDYPMISTNTNNKIIKNIYAGITPYLYYNDPESDKLSAYIEQSSNPLQMCQREEGFHKLIAKIDGLKSVLNFNKKTFNADKLKSLLFEYKMNQDNILKAIEKMGVFNLQKFEEFIIPAKAGIYSLDIKMQITWQEILYSDLDGMIENYKESLRISTSAEDKKNTQGMIDYLKVVMSKKQQIITENPKLENYQEHVDVMIKSMDNSRKMAQKIAVQEKKLYEELYRQDQSADSNDPCKKIIF